MEPLLTITEACKILRCSKEYLRQKCKRAEIDHYFYGGRYLFRPRTIEEEIRRSRRPAAKVAADMALRLR